MKITLKQPNSLKYPLNYKRRPTRSVKIKGVKIGSSSNNIVIQSMLTSNSSDEISCLKEIKTLVEDGCQMVRLSLLSRRDLDGIQRLKKILLNEGLEDIPLIADVHFSGHLAIDACEIFDKIRINPGNYSDNPKNYNQKNKSRYLFDEGYHKLKEKYKPLAKNLIKYKRALRIGVNQGSLSTRMIEKYGDSPIGMVNSALESIKIFNELGFKDLIVSLKSSNYFIANQAYRLFASIDNSINATPLHLGVTEAGNQLIGRLKCVSGIGTLLLDGIGDTIRVSLTEPSINEIKFGKELLKFINNEKKLKNKIGESKYLTRPLGQFRKNNQKIKISNLTISGGSNIKIGRKLNDQQQNDSIDSTDFIYQLKNNKLKIFIKNKPVDFNKKTTKNNIKIKFFDLNNSIYDLREFYNQYPINPISILKVDKNIGIKNNKYLNNLVCILSEGLVDILLIDDSIDNPRNQNIINEVLQATRNRLLKADFISCPSCGRTMFDLVKVTNQVKEKTIHLKGVKIGILGCIVNGPGEMADADFGYVGSFAGKVDLYYGQTRVKQNIPIKIATEKLIELIKEKGKWIDPPII